MERENGLKGINSDTVLLSGNNTIKNVFRDSVDIPPPLREFLKSLVDR